MSLVEINWNPSRKELRVFSLLLIGFGAVLATILHRHESAMPAAVALIVAAAIGLIGIVAPTRVRPLYVVWTGIVFPIGWTVSHLMMLAVFFLLVTPIGLAMRLCGRDPMQRRWNPGAKTYWQPRKPRRDLKSYFKQF